MRILAFLDSSTIVQSFKGDKKALEIIEELYTFIDRVNLCINVVVFSEVIYQLTYKRKFDLEEIDAFLSNLKFFSTNEEIKKKALEYMHLYYLKPNDALILATCKHYDIKYLISIDEDFQEPCQKEGIVLIDSVKKLRKVLEIKRNLD